MILIAAKVNLMLHYFKTILIILWKTYMNMIMINISAVMIMIDVKYIEMIDVKRLKIRVLESDTDSDAVEHEDISE